MVKVSLRVAASGNPRRPLSAIPRCQYHITLNNAQMIQYPYVKFFV
jgi:hypothetical protein